MVTKLWSRQLGANAVICYHLRSKNEIKPFCRKFRVNCPRRYFAVKTKFTLSNLWIRSCFPNDENQFPVPTEGTCARGRNVTVGAKDTTKVRVHNCNGFTYLPLITLCITEI